MPVALRAQTYSILHTFAGPEGANPTGKLTLDGAGNMYGTTSYGGADYLGTVVRLQHKNSGWLVTPIYTFQGGSDGGGPGAPVVVGPDGSLYGTTRGGGDPGCYDTYPCGVVFHLRPPARAPASVIVPWTESVLYQFTGHGDGVYPSGDLAFDQAGNLYGTTQLGGVYNGGSIYKLTRSNGGWTESVLYSFRGTGDGEQPYRGVIADSAGNLYGTAAPDGTSHGTVFELSPSGSGWIETTLYSFSGGSDGGSPSSGLVFDQTGNLYGTTLYGGTGNEGTLYKLTPSNGGWTFSVVYSYATYCEPSGTLVLDGAGNFYGTTFVGGPDQLGSVYKLSPSSGGWTYTDLHDFLGACPYPSEDGCLPEGVVMDAAGNLFGMTYEGGETGDGVVFELTPN
ncbi:MAG: choice-of-anchor tandem repeat GloVer-containing protein [Candidatus Korobacteraceae bacterium]